MSEILSNTQSQQYTTSNNGRNVRASLVVDSHFFVESGGVNTFNQNASQKFGAANDTQFRTTAKITFSGTKKLYAICQGQVFIVPQEGNSTKVNLILRPYKQPIRELPIKYFIYRGLNRNDFIAGTGDTATVAGSETSGTDFVKYIWKEFNTFYTNENSSEPTPSFLASMIGFSDGTTQQATDLIDAYFYAPAVFDETTQEETNAFEFPLIPKGIHLGNATGEVGLDIVLNKGDYYIENDPNPFQLDLTFARAADHILDTTNGDTDYKKKLIKESCTQFMDAAAFYGLHCNGLGKLYINAVDTPLTTKEDIYPHIQNFHTKNTTYLYIQSNRQRSYNFYGKYVYSDTNMNNLKLGADENSLVEQIFGTHGWPMHEIINQENSLMQFITDNYTGAGLYVKLGGITTAHEQNFVREGNLLQAPSTDENNPVDTKFTLPIGFKAEMVNTEAIAQPIQLIYEGVQMLVTEHLPPSESGQDPVEPQQYALKDIDDVFGLLNAHSFLQPKPNVLELPSVIEEELQLINFPNAQRSSDIGVVKTKRIADAIAINEEENIKRFTYETLLFNIKNNNSGYTKNNSASIDKSAAGTHSFSQQRNNFYQPAGPYCLKTELFTDNGNTITGLRLQTTDGSTPTKKILGLTKDENQQLLDLITTHNLSNCKVFFRGLSTDDFVSLEDVTYMAYSLGVVAESNVGKLELYFLDTELKVYAVDGLMYVSDVYGKHTPILDFNNNIHFIKHGLWTQV